MIFKNDNFSDSNFTNMPTWVEDYNLEYKKYRKAQKNTYVKFLIVIVLLLIFLVFLTIFEFTYMYYLITIMTTSSLILIMYVLNLIKYKFKSYEFLSSVIYETGFLLYKNDDPKPQIYVEKINTLLENWYLFIDVVEQSIVDSFYVINIRSFCKKLKILIMLLNEYSKNYDQYSINKCDISTQLMELANSIYEEKEDINKHIKLTDLLITDLQKENLKGKTINISLYDSFKEKIHKIYITIPLYIKLIITAVFVFSVVFFAIYFMGLWIGIEKEHLFSTSVAAAVMIVSIVVTIIRK